jgi:hypothetical protein
MNLYINPKLFQILTAGSSNLIWENAPSNRGWVWGGHSSGGDDLFICRFWVAEFLIPGKYHYANGNQCHVPMYGQVLLITFHLNIFQKLIKSFPDRSEQKLSTPRMPPHKAKNYHKNTKIKSNSSFSDFNVVIRRRKFCEIMLLHLHTIICIVFDIFFIFI